MNKVKIGGVFGRLTVVSQGEVNKRTWVCRCECGATKVVRSPLLLEGKTKSCGCLQSDLLRASKLTHGMSKSPTYGIWAGMISRCRLANRQGSASYFGKGIKVCERWQKFENFLADMGERPGNLTIERLDGNADYSPSNCVWATHKQQRANTSMPLTMLTFNGRTMCLKDWAAEIGVKYPTIYARYKRGLPAEKVLAVADLRL